MTSQTPAPVFPCPPLTLRIRTSALPVGGDDDDAAPTLDRANEVARVAAALPWHSGNMVWRCDDDALFGVGDAVRVEITGTHMSVSGSAVKAWEGECAEIANEPTLRFEWMSHVWAAIRSTIHYHPDQCGLDVGAGLYAFVSMGFTADDTSILVVPEASVRVADDGRAYLSVLGRTDLDPYQALGPQARTFLSNLLGAAQARPMEDFGEVTFTQGQCTEEGYRDAVDSAVNKLRAGRAQKVVLGRDVRIEASGTIDERAVLERLAARFPTCYTYCVGGLVGASPELLLRFDGQRLTSRVLAGTAAPSEGEALAASVKDQHEHELAAASVWEVLSSLGGEKADDAAPYRSEPFILELPNLVHLATDMEVKASASALLPTAGRLHPTAAVGGYPREAVAELIAEFEPSARGRCAAPIGWVDGRGHGALALALRCAQIDNVHEARAWAGCGIMPDSVGEAELEETRTKLHAIEVGFEA